jgi:hypothetical protein
MKSYLENNSSQSMAGGVAQNVGPEFKLQYSNSSTAKKKKPAK